MSQSTNHQNFYEILEVSPSAPQDEIRRAYHKAKETYSPNSPAIYSMFTTEEAQEINKMIEEAFIVLSNHESRRQYDQTLKKTAVGSDFTQNRTQSEGKKPEPSHLSIVPTIPKDHNKTPFGTYKKDDQFEEEIKLTTDYSGEFLKKIREYKCVDLDSLSERTRISSTYLKAIEADRYSDLPAPVFVRGFIVHIAKSLGLNENIVVNSYMSKFKSNKK